MLNQLSRNYYCAFAKPVAVSYQELETYARMLYRMYRKKLNKLRSHQEMLLCCGGIYSEFKCRYRKRKINTVSCN